MELDVILAAVKQFKEMGLSHVSLTGGEIFLYPKLKELIIALKKFNLSITLLTNATTQRKYQLCYIANNFGITGK